MTSSFTIDRAVPDRVLSISAHPDDSELQAGGTLAKWAASGCEVSLVVCTDGSKGTWNPDADLHALIETRQSEQRAAAGALGATGSIGFCGWIDGELESNRTNVGVLAGWIRRLRPTIVLAHDPWKRYRLHPDHRVAGFLVTDAVVAARDPHFFPELGLAHHRPDEVWYFEADEPNHAEQVEAWLGPKVSALVKHVSQLESTMGVNPDDTGSQMQAFVASIERAAADGAQIAGCGPAELFARITDI